MAVNTIPPDAMCELTREGRAIAFVNPTPGTAMLEKSSADVSILCSKPEHFNGMATLSSEFQNMTVGNVIFGGIIGVAVDAASGAMHEYPSSITVVLTPKKFTSAAVRDAYFRRLASHIDSEASAALTKVGKTCVPSEQDCQALTRAVQADREARQRDLEAQRLAATIE